MSDPTPTPAADPTTDPTPDPVTDPANPPADPPADPDPADDGKDPRVTRANAEAAKYRTQLRETQQALSEQGKTLQALAAVFNPDGGDDPDPAALTGQVEQLTTRTAQLEAELLVHSIAGDNGGNPVALLDSRTFATTLHGLDPAADDYRDQVAAAITDAVSKNANLSTGAGQGPGRGGAAGAGQGAAQPDGAVTQEQFDAMGYDQRAELYSTNPALYRRLAGTAT